MKHYSLFTPVATLLVSMALTACGGGTEGIGQADTAINAAGEPAANADGPTASALAVSYSVGGKVAGLEAGKTIVLVNKGGNALTMTADGVFVFSTKWATRSTYNVAVSVPPAGQTCEVVRPSGTIQSWNITDVRVFCTSVVGPATYTLGGALTGLGSGKTVGLQDGAGHALSLSASGTFNFATPLPSGTAYAVTVATQPVNQTCTVSNDSGTIDVANVTDVSVVCADNVVPTYSVGGNLSGLGAGKSVVLSNNAGDNLSLSASGTFTFATRLLNGAAYNVAVLTQPVGQTCTANSGSGAINLANVASVGVVCVDNVVPTYSVGGNLSGLGVGKNVVLRNNGGDNLTLSAGGTFTFATRLTNSAVYAVTVLTQPTGQTCAVSSGSGAINLANIATVGVACVDNTVTTYSVGGNLSGLGAGKSVVLRNNGGGNLSLSAVGAFTFTTRLPSASAYAVTVLTQPVGQTCTVSNGSGTIASANVTNVAVNCSTTPSGAWQNFTLGVNAEGKATLTLTSSEALLANAPFFGIEVRKNGVDITDDITNIETVGTSNTSWRYTFGTQVLNTSGATITLSLRNKAVASPGHYVAVRGYGQNGGVQGTYQLLLDCQNGVGECAGRGAKPGLLAAVKGMSNRYAPRDLESRAIGANVSTYNFSPIFNDAAFLASKGMRLNVIFTFKSFGTNTLQNGNGSNRAFDIPLGNTGWDKGRAREIEVYVKNANDVWNKAAFQFNGTRTQVILNTAPAWGNKNVNVVYARDPFPEYVWQMNPSVASWYNGKGGQNNDAAAGGGNHGHVYAPWRANTVPWLRSFMAAFQTQWNNAIAAGLSDAAIESVTIQETAMPLGDLGTSTYDPTYTVAGYRAGLFELSKATARAVRRKALFGQMFNIIPQGNDAQAMGGLSSDIILWGARLEGSDLFNHEQTIDENVYQNVHRAFNDKTLTMIWQQNASYSERKNKSINDYSLGNLYTPAQQFIKAQRGVSDYSTPGGMRGLQAEYMFWNMTTDAPLGSPLTFVKDAVPVIAANPMVQTSGNDRYLWRRAINATPIADQTLSKTNP